MRLWQSSPNACKSLPVSISRNLWASRNLQTTFHEYPSNFFPYTGISFSKDSASDKKNINDRLSRLLRSYFWYNATLFLGKRTRWIRVTRRFINQNDHMYCTPLSLSTLYSLIIISSKTHFNTIALRIYYAEAVKRHSCKVEWIFFTFYDVINYVREQFQI